MAVVFCGQLQVEGWGKGMYPQVEEPATKKAHMWQDSDQAVSAAIKGASE